jgi:hypothetical protein
VLAEALLVIVEGSDKMARWKTKSPKKQSVRERQRLEGAATSGKIPSGHKGVSLSHAVDRFIREGSCRHKHPLGNPCVSFDVDAKGACNRDWRICDVLTEKGKRYWADCE